MAKSFAPFSTWGYMYKHLSYVGVSGGMLFGFSTLLLQFSLPVLGLSYGLALYSSA